MRTICPPDHKHAENRTCYCIHRCGCVPCREASTAAERERRKLKAYGRYDSGLVDAGPVREHIERLREYGIGWKRIAEVAGLGYTTVETVIYGHKTRKTMNQRVKRETAEKILAVQPILENLRPGALIPSIGAQRRVQALVWNGWAMRKLAIMAGMEPGNLNRLMERDQCSVVSFLKIRALYDRLWNTQPKVERPYDNSSIARARNLARRKGWVSAWAWDDIDDPDETPDIGDAGTVDVDHAAVLLAITGEPPVHRWTDAELDEIVRVLNVEQRMSDNAIASHLGVKTIRVYAARDRVGIEPVPLGELMELRKLAA